MAAPQTASMSNVLHGPLALEAKKLDDTSQPKPKTCNQTKCLGLLNVTS